MSRRPNGVDALGHTDLSTPPVAAITSVKKGETKQVILTDSPKQSMFESLSE
jgi:hypothetical protein